MSSANQLLAKWIFLVAIVVATSRMSADAASTRRGDSWDKGEQSVS